MTEQSAKMFQAIFENSPVGLVIVNQDTTLRQVNHYMFSVFKLPPKTIEGKMFGNVFHCEAVNYNKEICGEADECKNCGLRSGVTMVLNEGTTIPDTIMDHDFIIDGASRKKWFKISATRIDSEEDTFAIVSFVDITTQKEYEEILNNQLSIDMATGITNKYTLLSTLKSLTAGSESLSVAMIDFDGFKAVNDTYGHVAGDRVLNIFCSVAAENCRKVDIVARFGGEEFMLVFPGASSDLLIKSLKRIHRNFRDECNKELNMCPTFSAGIAEFSSSQLNEMDVSSIISKADHNLYLSKTRGKNMITVDGVSMPYE